MKDLFEVFVCSPQDKGTIGIHCPTDLTKIMETPSIVEFLRTEGRATPAAREILESKFGVEMAAAQEAPISGQQVVFTDGVEFVGAVVL